MTKAQCLIMDIGGALHTIVSTSTGTELHRHQQLRNPRTKGCDMGILRYVKLDLRQVVALLALTLVGAATEMGLPTLLALMIDNGIATGTREVIAGVAAAMVALALAGFASSLAATVISARISTTLAADLRSKVFRKVQSFSSADMDRFGTASLVTRTTSDVTNVQFFVTMLMQMGVMSPLMLVAGLVLSSATGGRLSMVLLVSVPIVLVLAALIMPMVSRLSRRMRRRLDDLNRVFLETLEGVRPIRAFRREDYEMRRFGEANDAHASVAIAQGTLIALIMPLVGLIFGFTTTAVLWFGAGYVAAGSMEVGALVANVQYISMILMSIMLVSALIMFYPNFAACAGRICEVLDAEPAIVDGTHPIAERTTTGTLEFRQVGFRYANAEKPVLSDISFVCKPGTVTALIGPTGSGKSTLLRLVPRFFDATEGSVIVDGLDVRDYRLSDLRDLIGYVPQKNVLFSGEVADNLNWGDEHGNEEDWERALRLACATDFVTKREGGAHASVSQGGSNFSGGQRQRLAIARALMRKAEFYLFDDSFSALDLRTDRELRANIRRELSQATVLIVAQRVGTIIDADQIVVLDDGVCVGRGTHRELLQTCDTYREIASLQLGEQAVVDELRAARGLPSQGRSQVPPIAPAAATPPEPQGGEH